MRRGMVIMEARYCQKRMADTSGTAYECRVAS